MAGMTPLWSFWHEKKSAEIKADYTSVNQTHSTADISKDLCGRKRETQTQSIPVGHFVRLLRHAMPRSCRSRSGLIRDFNFVPGPQWASDCENDSIYKIHLVKEINRALKMKGRTEVRVTSTTKSQKHTQSIKTIWWNAIYMTYMKRLPVLMQWLSKQVHSQKTCKTARHWGRTISRTSLLYLPLMSYL